MPTGYTTFPLATDAFASIAPQVLSDGSTTYNVVADLDGTLFTFGCADEHAAQDLINALNAVCWFETDKDFA